MSKTGIDEISLVIKLIIFKNNDLVVLNHSNKWILIVV